MWFCDGCDGCFLEDGGHFNKAIIVIKAKVQSVDAV